MRPRARLDRRGPAVWRRQGPGHVYERVWLRTSATPMSLVWARKRLVLGHYFTLRWTVGEIL